MRRPKAQLIDGFYVVGDLAYTPAEWERRARELERKREYNRSYYPLWRERNRERARHINREHMRRKRGGGARVVRSPEERRARQLHRERTRAVGGEYRALQVTASLHSLKCTGPTQDTGCRCKKTLIVREVEK